VARQFAQAKAVRNWTSTNRLQYGATQLAGHRYCLLSHAAGFIDPLFSSGLVLTTATVDLLAKQLFHSFETNDFAVENYGHINDFFQRNVEFFDRVVGNSFLSFRDYELWDAWFRIWVVGLLIGTELNGKLHVKYLEKRDKSVFDASEHAPHIGVLGSEFQPFRELFESAAAEMDRVRAGADPKEVAARIREMFRSLNYVPTYFRWHDYAVRTTPAFTVGGMTRMYFWYLFKSPRPVFEALYGWRPLTAYRYILSSILKNVRLARRRRRGYVRDVFKAWNQEWVTPGGEAPRVAARETKAPVPKVQVTSAAK
jgi:tetracycline 7-halogenase / FADH2 O2-dependent halogenase